MNSLHVIIFGQNEQLTSELSSPSEIACDKVERVPYELE